MAEIYQTTLTPTKLELLADWMGSQRWFAAKGRTPVLRRLGGYRLDDPDGQVGVETLIVADESGSQPVVYQVPLTYRGAPLGGADAAFLGTMEHGVLGTRYIYDGAHDPVYARALLELARGQVQAQHATQSHTVDPAVTGSPHPGAEDVTFVSAKVLSGEQSNTSIIYEATDAAGKSSPVVVKVFRMLHPGQNPDVVLQSALAAQGSPLVPLPLGHVTGDWADPAGGDERCVGHLAFAQEFLPGTRDAWRVAREAARAGEDFTGPAFDLGVATAGVHETLAQVLPTQEADEDRRAALVAGWRSRLVSAVSEAPALQEHADHIEAIFDRAAAASWPALQRVHGDYHLGQVLQVPGRGETGWVLLDFEGEPLRSLTERSAPDLALRDVAGMLRSFDYAAGSIERESGFFDSAAIPAPVQPGEGDPTDSGTPRQWAQASAAAFVQGYASAWPGADLRTDPDTATLLEALLLDKALYEVVYEARNRPAWISIPLGAIESLCAGPATSLLAPTTPDSDEPDRSVGQPAHPKDRSPETMAQKKKAAGEPAAVDTTPAEYHSAPLPVDPHELDLLVRGGHGDPHSILGAHPFEGGVTIRAFRPLAQTVQIELPDGSLHVMDHDYEGIWVRQLDDIEVSDYRLHVTYGDDYEHVQDDPYRFLPTLGEMDLYLIGEGRHEELWKVLGSHVRTYPGQMGEVHGASFAVWAPNARAIRVVGDFNRWDGQMHPMRALGSTGVWELFVPGVGENTPYKYEILGADGFWRGKADPLARHTECPPATASVVDESHYEWGDSEWMQQRAGNIEPHNGPMSVYECHLGSWRQGSSYVDLAEHLVNYVKDLGFTHVEFLPVAEHPYGPSWGYQVTGYYAPTSRFGSPDEFRYLVDKLHQAGIGVILDWVPAHFPKDAFALARFDGQALYEHSDPRRGDQPDWGTHVFDFGRPQVRNFLVANASFWIEEFHIDGLRVDAVASMLYLDYSRNDGEWLPNQYGGREHLEAVQLLQEMNATVYRRYPGAVTIAEESTSWPGITKPTYMGGLGFGLKWNMGWMHDTLGYASLSPIYRQYHHHEMTFSMVYAYSENFCLPISHDEVVYGKGSMLRKMPGDRWEQLAGMRVYYAFMWSHPGKQLLFMGQEFAQEAEWADARSLDWWLLDHEPHWRMHKLVKDLNHLYVSHPALWELDNDWSGFTWIDANDASGNTYSYLRFGHADENGERPTMAVIANFSGAEHHHYRVGLPKAGPWKEVLNTDSVDYGGSGVGNLGQIVAEEVPWHGQPYSALVTLPKLGAVWFEPVSGEVDEAEFKAAEAGPSIADDAPTGSLRAQTPGQSRPELSQSPVAEDQPKASGIDPADLANPRVGTSGGHASTGSQARIDADTEPGEPG
ncbi:1,4-alpha-glucan branching enzyme [Kineosphaera limosa]|uniref:1,4-alpha-glucan branching enzyme GlgB n=1 Tax=Kineosphaera limosa NBRC 100340 TaxID=1184609 RepID=K6XA38_9MICO|nr:1,4-alpha-glucan branching protein GlgB [Kineosphaera limosa]NYD99549.1 1,4-alpha-glucan branching enzyme [Kineosphaera limosa]GAB95694.1 1,4-alpha-glucan-branching enzyme [Kineosphaera limosa NBRC 100340]